MEDRGAAQERHDHRPAADHRDHRNHGVGIAQRHEVGEVGQRQKNRNKRYGPAPVERGSGAAPRPPHDGDDDGHHRELIEVVPPLHENGVELRHDEFVVQPAHGSGERREGHEDDPDIVREVDPLAAARAAQQQQRHERQPHAGPLAEVEPLAEDEHRPHEHHDGPRGVDRTHDRYGQVLDAEVAEYPRREDDRRLERHEPVGMGIARRRGEHRAVEPAPAAAGGKDRGQEYQRREERVEQQHRQHGILRERLFLGRVVKPEQGSRNECERQPHGFRIERAKIGLSPEIGKSGKISYLASRKSDVSTMKNIRNFCIIAHIDHGKSTLADRLLEKTNTLNQREMQAQVLDDMDLEREKGITIKSHAIQMEYTARDGQRYVLNLIDTPGHVDFSYEVSRAIASCEGALLVVDATQGIQAQTISNLYLAVGHDLEIIPVLNKIDMDSAMIDEVKDQVIDLIGCKDEDILLASGKTGLGVEEVLEAIVQRIPAPQGDENGPLQALIFDSVFNPFRGIIAYYRVFNGTLRKGDHVKFFNTGSEYDADEIGVLKLKMQPRQEIKAGDVGYICSGIKTSSDVKVGDTITAVARPADEAIAGFEDVKPMVFAGVYPVEADQYEDLRASLEKLQLNDASLTFEPESSLALGFGFRCGFLGLLHMEIIQERLYREFDMDVITTVPNVSYRITTTQGDTLEVHNPSGLPEITKIAKIEEPYILAQIITKSEFLGNVIKLCIDKRGVMKNQTFITQDRVEVNFDMPLSEIVFDFYDKLKSISKGYASFDYHRTGYQLSKLVKLDILLNGEPVDALSSLIYADHAYDFGRKMCEKLKELIPRQQFDIAIQAAIGAKIIARETVKAVRKDVTAKCYGGDISRKRKLLEKQKKGKKRMRQIGNVEVPQSAFLAVLKMD